MPPIVGSPVGAGKADAFDLLLSRDVRGLRKAMVRRDVDRCSMGARSVPATDPPARQNLVDLRKAAHRVHSLLGS
jgi:hypothetical protein